MTKKKAKSSNLRSTCCEAEIKYVTSPDEIDKIGCTSYCTCTKCGEPCNIFAKERKVWTRNPKTQIIQSNKKKEWDRLTKEEANHYRKNEDF